MLKVGITGGIGSGKSTVCLVFKQMGVPVYSADNQAKLLIYSDKDLRKAICEEFGEESFINGNYNRDYIAEIVFSNPERLNKLNQIIHPAVTNDFNNWAKKYKNKSYIIHEAAILFESGTAGQMHKNIIIDAPEDIRVRRIIKRDGTDRNSALARIKNQWPADKIRSLADWIIVNDGKNLILPQILKIHEQLIKG